MSHKYDSKALFLLCVLLSGCLIMFSPVTSHAITKSISIVGVNGQPLPNTTITITFQDGTKEEEDTDDKGILIFNFKSKGEYVLTDPTGNVVKTMSITGMGTDAKVAIGAGVLAILAMASNSDSNSTNESDSNSSSTANPESASPASEESSAVSLAGNYIVNYALVSNPGGHPDLIPENTQVEVKIQGSNITFYEMRMHGTHDGVNFVATSTGSYAGYSTSFVFEGSQNTSTGQISGTLTIGGDGKLPGGQPIVYSCTGAPI